MNRILSSVMAASALLAGVALVDTDPVFAQGSATVGSLRGIIRDKANGEPAAGATVVATSPALQGEQVVITEGDGVYYITSLPPGLYVLTVYYNDATFSRGNVLIQIGKEAVVNVTVDSGASAGKPKGEVITISGSAPIVDQGSTKTGITITDDYTRNIPTARTFGGVMSSAAGAQTDNYGISLAGATSYENTYIVEGINTTDTAFGGISSNLPNEFINETEVITGGYNAEFGRATGGIINVVTKSGSNEFRGSVFGYYQPGSFISAADKIQREGSSIDSAEDLDYRYDVGGELGGPIIKDKLWFHVGFNPSVSHRTATRIVNTSVDKNQDGVPDVDENGFTTREELSRQETPEDFKTYFFTAKINGAISQNHQFQISAFGNPRVAEDVVGFTRNPAQTRWKYNDGAYDFSAKWTSKFNEGKTQIDAVAGYHHGYEHQNPYDAAAQDVPTLNYNYERSLYAFNDLENNIGACNDADPNDPYPLIRNCPVTGYTEQGLSFLESRDNTRTSGTVSLTQRVKAAGYHVFKIGVDAEVSTYDNERGYTGGVFYRRSSGGNWQEREFVTRVRNLTPEEQADPDSVMLTNEQIFCASGLAICSRADTIASDTTNRSLGAYVQDSWQLLPNFTLNLGLRWEQQVGYVADSLKGQITPEGEITPDRAFEINNNWAPRIGVIYDPTKEGKSKIFGHWGRFYENVPMDINVRAFGGEITNFNAINGQRLTPTDGGYDPNCTIDHLAGSPSSEIIEKLNTCSDRVTQSTSGGGFEYVSPGLKGQHTDEVILGAEYEIASDIKFSINYIHRSLPTVIEDISTDGGNTYLITNPGFDFTSEANEVQAQADALMASSDPVQQALGSVYQGRANSLRAVGRMEKPIRNYDALQFTATQRPTKASLVIASYTYSQSKGNYPGLFSTETGQNDPNLTSQYDLPTLLANRYGVLGLDRPHNLKLDGFYLFDLKKIGEVVVGASLRGQSGIAHNYLGNHPIYGNSESYILARGSAERSPFTTQADVRLSYGYRLNKTTKVEAFVNVFNLFNQQEQLTQDENYTFDAVNPIINGDPSDLEHLKTIDQATQTEVNATPQKNKNYGNTGSTNANITNNIQAPRSVQLGFRVTF